MSHEISHRGYLISDDPTLIDSGAVHAFLSRSYWAANIPLRVVQSSLKNSLCVGVYTATGIQIGFARIISDFTTFAYLCDVYILEDHRGRQLSKKLMEAIATHPRLQNLRRFNLVTQDAHGLYAQFGFTPVANPERYMEKVDPDISHRWQEQSKENLPRSRFEI